MTRSKKNLELLGCGSLKIGINFDSELVIIKIIILFLFADVHHVAQNPIQIYRVRFSGTEEETRGGRCAIASPKERGAVV